MNVTVTVAANDGVGGALSETFEIEVVDFVPSSISGRVFIFNDVNGNGRMESTEIGVGLAGIPIWLQRTDIQNQPVVEILTDRNGRLQLHESTARHVPASVKDNRTVSGTDRTGSLHPSPRTETIRDSIAIGLRGGVASSLNNNFTEMGLEARYVTAMHLLASADPNSSTGMGLVLSTGQSPWHIFKDGSTAQPWAGYHSAQFTMNSDGLSGVLKVRDSAGQLKQATVTVSSGRLRPSQDGKVMTIIGSPSDLNFTNVSEGEGEAGDYVAAAAADYQRGADAIFGAMGDGRRQPDGLISVRTRAEELPGPATNAGPLHCLPSLRRTYLAARWSRTQFVWHGLERDGSHRATRTTVPGRAVLRQLSFEIDRCAGPTACRRRGSARWKTIRRQTVPHVEAFA